MVDQAPVDAFAAVRGWLIEEGYPPELLPDGRTLSFVFDGQNSDLYVYVYVPETIDVVVVYCSCPFDIPQNTIEAAKEFVARVNYTMLVGSLDLNVDDGDLRFRCSVDFRGVGLTQDLFRNVRNPPAFGMDRYLPAIRALVIEQRSPLEALAVI